MGCPHTQVCVVDSNCEISGCQFVLCSCTPVCKQTSSSHCAHTHVCGKRPGRPAERPVLWTDVLLCQNTRVCCAWRKTVVESVFGRSGDIIALDGGAMWYFQLAHIWMCCKVLEILFPYS